MVDLSIHTVGFKLVACLKTVQIIFVNLINILVPEWKVIKGKISFVFITINTPIM